MFSKTLVILAVALVAHAKHLDNLSPLVPRSYTIDPASCSDASKQNVIKEEMGHALEMAKYTQSNLETGPFYKTFFPNSLTQHSAFATQVKQVFGRLAQMADPNDDSHKILITCDDTTNFCRGGYVAHMRDLSLTNSRMNVCAKFFATDKFTGDRTKTISTQNFIDACKNDECHADQLYFAARTKSATLLHEMTHTRFSNGGGPPSLDYAYGVGDCIDLADNKFDRSKRPYGQGNRKYKSNGDLFCPKDPNNPKGEEGICDPEFTQENADSYALPGAGVYYSKQCGKTLGLDRSPIGPPPPSSKFLSKRATACNITLPAVGYFQPDAVYGALGNGNVSLSNSTSTNLTRLLL